jgi:eukaryotic-like serine/threonine-protein kinase
VSERSRRRGPTPADQYRQLWHTQPSPSLEGFIAELPLLTSDDLLDVIEADRAERWRRGERVKAERYLRDFPAVRNDPEASLVIIYGEFYLCKELGESPSLTEYISRFPTHARRLRDQVMWHEAIELGSHTVAQVGLPEISGYTVSEMIGRGGMCSVYRALDEKTGQDVAIKLLDRDHLHHPMRVARFRREIGSLMRLRHPHIVLAHRTGDANGVPYLVMEFCVGGTLVSKLAGQALSVKNAGMVIQSLAHAVEYAHSQGVIHRDLKPGNVLLSIQEAGDEGSILIGEASYRPKVSDFGLAKCESGADSAITATRETLGTPCYMAPELTTGARDADLRTDVYGLGAILYEVLTGRPPFVAQTPLEVVRMLREEPPFPPNLLNPQVPDALQAVCLKCLEKEPDHRYQSAAQLLAAVS